MRDGAGQKNGRGDKKREENHFHFFTEPILDYCTSSKNGLLDKYVTTQPTRRRA